MDVLRTPDSCFADLPGYPFEPHYIDVGADRLDPVRMHYLDEGPADGPVALLMHGQPTWSYLYRKVVPVLVAQGIRVIAPDNIGFGRSDKPAEPTDYTFSRHIEWTRSLVTGLDLREVTLVAQDWGGPIGFSVLAAEPDRFARVVAANTILHTADPGWPTGSPGRSTVTARRGSSSRRRSSTTCSTPSGRRSCGPATSSASLPRARSRPRSWRRTTRRTRSPATPPACGR